MAKATARIPTANEVKRVMVKRAFADLDRFLAVTKGKTWNDITKTWEVKAVQS